jgi:putative spermidine/putrescine transport system permease protein
MKISKLITGVLTVLTCIFLFLPLLVMLASSFTQTAYVSFPPQGFTLSWYLDALNMTELRTSFVSSIVAAALVVVITVPTALLAALAVRRASGALPLLTRQMITAPLLVPQVVIGLSILQLVYAARAPLSIWLVVLGHSVIALPFAFRTIDVALRDFDERLMEAAQALGTPPLRAFFNVMLPLIRPGVVASAVFVFIISFSNINVSVFLTTPTLKMLPVVMYQFLSFESVRPSIAAAAVVLALIAAVAAAFMGPFLADTRKLAAVQTRGARRKKSLNK